MRKHILFPLIRHFERIDSNSAHRKWTLFRTPLLWASYSIQVSFVSTTEEPRTLEEGS